MSADQTSNSNSNSNQNKDPAWCYFTCPNGPNDKNTTKCIFCGKESKGGIFRAKQHLAGDSSNVTHCRLVPDLVKEEIINYMLKKKNEKEGRNLATNYDDDIVGVGVGDDVDDLEMICNQKRRMPSLGRSGSGSGSNSESSLKKPKQKGPLDLYYNKTPLKQTKLGERETEVVKKELRDRVCKTFARWMYDAGIPFNAVKYPSFKPFCEAVGQYGPGVKPPSYHEVRVPLLKKEVELTREAMKVHEDEWKTYGCSILSDGWKDRRERTLINFLVNSPRGSVFVESVDASAYAKTGEKMFELLSQFVEKIGVSNVVQVVTDSASNNVLAGKYLEAKYENLFWTPCAAHCLDLILEDIFKLKRMKQTFERAVMVNSYIYGRTGVVNMLRKYTNMKELLRPAKTRFATAFITLSRIHNQKTNLRKMFTSDEWAQKQWAKEAAAKKVVEVILMPSFWNNIVFALKIAGPLVKVLRLVDGERKPPMGYIYEAMDRAKEAIAKSFGGNESKYGDIFKLIDARWNIQLHRPLHGAGWFLNPEFFYTTRNVDDEVANGLYTCIERLVPDVETRCQIDLDLAQYKKAERLFGSPMGVRMRGKKSPAEWWVSYGTSTPTLQKFAIKILSLTCSSSGCERNWSVFENLHTKRRNRLDQSRLNDLVFVKYNRSLRRRYELRDTIDPIYLNDIDDSNEWLTGRLDDDSARDDELVFTAEDNLTWNDVATAAGVRESSYRFRSREASSSRPRVPQQSQIRPSNQLLHEEESEEEIEGEDEGDQLQQDEEIGGDDDYEFDFDA